MAGLVPNDNPAMGFKPVINLAGGAIPMWKGRYKSATDAVPGNVVFATVGYIVSADTADGCPLGVAASGVTAATSQDLLFYPAADWLVYYGQCSGAMTQAKVWTLVDFEQTDGSSTAKAEVNEDATTSNHLWVIGIDTTYSIGAYSRVYFTFAQSKFSVRTVKSYGLSYYI